MAQTSLIQVRVDDNFKKDVDNLLADLGLDTPTAIRIFLKQVLMQKGLPFSVNMKTDVQQQDEVTYMPDDDFFNISDSLMEENKEAYEVLAR